MGLFSSKKSIPNESCYSLFVNNIGLMYNFIKYEKKILFTKDSNEGKMLYDSFLYVMEAKQNQTLDENNLKLNKEQKQILKKVMILVRESLFEEETSDAKDCILEFSSCIMKNESINKSLSYENFKKILSENDISFGD